jgi:hypothetical protein
VIKETEKAFFFQRNLAVVGGITEATSKKDDGSKRIALSLFDTSSLRCLGNILSKEPATSLFTVS